MRKSRQSSFPARCSTATLACFLSIPAAGQTPDIDRTDARQTALAALTAARASDMELLASLALPEPAEEFALAALDPGDPDATAIVAELRQELERGRRGWERDLTVLFVAPFELEPSPPFAFAYVPTTEADGGIVLLLQWQHGRWWIAHFMSASASDLAEVREGSEAFNRADASQVASAVFQAFEQGDAERLAALTHSQNWISPCLEALGSSEVARVLEQRDAGAAAALTGYADCMSPYLLALRSGGDDSPTLHADVFERGRLADALGEWGEPVSEARYIEEEGIRFAAFGATSEDTSPAIVLAPSSCRSCPLENGGFWWLWPSPSLVMPADSASKVAEASRLEEDAALELDRWRRCPTCDPGSLRRGLDLLGEATDLWRQVGDRGGEAAATYRIGSVHQVAGSADSALVRFRASLELAREGGDSEVETRALSGIGSALLTLDQPDSATLYLTAALESARSGGEPWRLIAALASLGQALWRSDAPEAALPHLREALDLARANDEPLLEAQVLGNLGALYDWLGRPDSALVYFGQALVRQREVGELGRLSEGGQLAEAATLANLGGAYWRLGRPDSALAAFHEAIRVGREAGDAAWGDEATVLSNIALLYRSVEQHDSAEVYMERAALAARSTRNEILELNLLIASAWDAGAPDSVIALAHRVIPAARRGRHGGIEATALLHIGAALLRLEQPDSALAYYRAGLEMERETGDPRSQAGPLALLAELHTRSGRLRQGVAYMDSAAAVLTAVRQRAGLDINQVSFAEQLVGLHEAWALAWLGLAPEVGEGTAALSALAAAERGRGQALLELMRTSEVIEPGRDLAAEGAELTRAITEAGSTGLSYLVTKDTLLIWLIPPTGEVQVVRQQVSADTLANLVDQLRWDLGVDDAATRNRLARSGLRLEPRGEESTRSRAVRGARAAAWPSEAARQLSELLLPPEARPLLSEAGEVVLVTHASLNLLPFAALPIGAEGEPLGARHPIRFAPSLAILREARRRSTGTGEPLVVGNPAMPLVTGSDGSQEQLMPLPGAEAEAEWLGTKMGQTILTGEDATESAVRARLPEASLIHLATHGYAYASEGRARDSYVALAPSPDHDGLLTVGEVLDEIPALQADLVSLSACQTGLGDLKQAEGTVGLQRAFLARGARSVLVSLWSVSDTATALLMERFYTYWLGLELEGDVSISKAEALRRAQVDVRATSGFDHPRFWAAFQLVGAN